MLCNLNQPSANCDFVGLGYTGQQISFSRLGR
jgi:hypothetical protein